MSALRVTQPFAAFIMVCIILGCTSTKFSAIWKDETYPGNPAKILVINTFKDPSIRRHFQDEMVKALKDRKVDAVAQAKEVGADTVLITRPAGTSGHSYFNTHTDVYDMKTNKLIAFVSAETRMQAGSPDPRDYISYVPSYVKDLVQKLSKAGLF
jgi:hypothetical protein